jgi:hypothetical protein
MMAHRVVNGLHHQQAIGRKHFQLDHRRDGMLTARSTQAALAAAIALASTGCATKGFVRE